MSHQSEAQLENNLIKQLVGLDYQPGKINDVALTVCEKKLNSSYKCNFMIKQ